jgi:hypothetical protein
MLIKETPSLTRASAWKCSGFAILDDGFWDYISCRICFKHVCSGYGGLADIGKPDATTRLF